MNLIRARLKTFIPSFFALSVAVALSIAAHAATTLTLAPTDNIQAAVAAAPINTTFLLQAGTYRMQSVVPKNGDTFSGQGSVVMDGSQSLSFVSDPRGTGLWVASAVADSSWKGVCQSTSPLCGYDQDLFIDSILQTPVASPNNLAAGTWYFDRAHGKLYLPTNPSAHVVELGMTNYAFSGNASNVEIDHITVEKYATPALQGAIGGYSWGLGSGWDVNVVESTLNHGGGISLGARSQILNSYIHHNGQIGIKFSYAANCLASNNEISWNNTLGFDPEWEAGGSKFWSTTNLVVSANYVHDNYGKGLWTDTNNVDTLYDGNSVVNNQGVGIQHEVSYSVIIRNNTVKGNAAAPTTWLGDAQIRIISSSNGVIFNNVVETSAAGGNGIAVINLTRGTGTQGPWVAANNYVHDNTITYLDTDGLSGMENDSAGNTAGVGNVFDSNTYNLANCAETHWVWNVRTPVTWSAIKSLGQETHGTYSIAQVANGTMEPVLSVSSTSFKFANTYVGTTQTFKSFTITNLGSTALLVCSISPSGTNASSFSVPIYHQGCDTVAAASSCSFDVAFTPATAGNLSAALQINSNAGNGSQSVSLTGVGISK
jgi:hypothetical protein